MEADLVRLWATPSTLHLRVVVWTKHRQHMQSAEIHYPLKSLTSVERRSLLEALRVDELGPADAEDQPIPGL